MKKIIRLFLILLLAGLAFIIWTMLPFRLPVSGIDLPARLPDASPPAEMRLSLLHTGKMIADEMSAFRGGSPFKKYESGMAAVLVQHPTGDYLIDTGFGRQIESHLQDIPPIMQLLSEAQPGHAAADQLVSAGYSMTKLKGILLTHSHWDHVSGVQDFPNTPVLLDSFEKGYITSGKNHTALARSMPADRFQTYRYKHQSYLGFSKSLDIHGDGSLILVPMPGHTPGSTGIFVTLPSGKRYFFIGDLVWMIEGIERPAERPWMARRMVDANTEAVREMINHVHQLSSAFPELIIVPAHDARVHSNIAVFPDSES